MTALRKDLVIGIDFGTESMRAILVNAVTGDRLSQHSFVYPRFSKQLYCNPAIRQFRQHPLDYLEGLNAVLPEVLDAGGPDARSRLSAISAVTTGSTPCPVDAGGAPLALQKGFEEDPDAMFWLWKDHTAALEADRINQVLSEGDEDYTRYQGVYASEWFWAKILHCALASPGICDDFSTWVEHNDWITAVLTGTTCAHALPRSSCAAGHKALWHSDFGGLPDPNRLAKLHPSLARVASCYGTPQPAGSMAGLLSPEWAAKLGVSPEVVVGHGSLDAHAGAVGAGIKPGTLVKVMGTSSVDMLVERRDALLDREMKAFCGLAEDSILPGYVGIEAGQAAFGDVYSWFRDLLLWPLTAFAGNGRAFEQRARFTREVRERMLLALEKEARKIQESSVSAVDWFNGRRYPHLNEHVRGAIFGLDVGSTAPELYRALVMATVFGSRRMLDGYLENGLTVERLILVGGIAQKSPYIVQMMADVLRRPVMVSKQEQACAWGAAIYASVAAGHYPDIIAAQASLCEPYCPTCWPQQDRYAMYNALYRHYLAEGELVQRVSDPG